MVSFKNVYFIDNMSYRIMYDWYPSTKRHEKDACLQGLLLKITIRQIHALIKKRIFTEVFCTHDR